MIMQIDEIKNMETNNFYFFQVYLVPFNKIIKTSIVLLYHLYILL